ncbi:MAG: hypothetical protein UR23_C0060G0003 [Candidatus Roizmanbacteria bacterium GW2011_GWA2_32_13]|uniref:Uncharacterized protein n=1 Tax=Candidatus Roizmanbacteria bacterium GW2011_GWA2_32_13 TaxID=1618475 RepID=A0A0F9YMD6_9BACT|nr:MAG: hypothetical protein UR23_C0060G0003 [Candidatus Roizmanbacteria bacterium GW2011_GWA2_32_13]
MNILEIFKYNSILSIPLFTVIALFNFILKSLLDFGFALYVINRFNIPYYSLLGFSLILSFIFFGFLAYFIEDKYSVIHKIFTYSSGVFWAVSQILLAQLTKDLVFITFTNVLTFIVLFLTLGFLFVKKTNVIVQAVCMFLLYSWIVIFVFRYL